MNKKIIIYTTEYCSNCNKIKEYLTNKNIKFIEKNMNDIESLTELATNNIFTNIAPVVQIKDKFYTYNEIFDSKNDINYDLF